MQAVFGESAGFGKVLAMVARIAPVAVSHSRMVWLATPQAEQLHEDYLAERKKEMGL